MNLSRAVGTLATMLAIAGCGSKPVGAPCKENRDCNGAVMRGVCMHSVLSQGYCTDLCDKDADCGNPAFVCGAAEITKKGVLGDSKQDARYCTKKTSDLSDSINKSLKKKPAK